MLNYILSYYFKCITSLKLYAQQKKIKEDTNKNNVFLKIFIMRTFMKYQISKVITTSQNDTTGRLTEVFNGSHKNKNVNCIVIIVVYIL